MHRVLLGLTILLAFASAAYAIKCYQCATPLGQNCDRDNLEAKKDDFLVDCSTLPGSFDRCMRVWGKKDDKTIIGNSCSNEDLCKSTKEDCDKSDDKCAVGCCDSDACNAASPVSFSVFLMIASALAGLVAFN